MHRALLGGLALISPVPALAQAAGCTAPAVLPRPRFDGPNESQPVRRIPTASYTLAISWSPQFCRGGNAAKREPLRCGGRLGSFGFTLHGLWPDGAGKNWPQYCRQASLLPAAVIRQNICVTPSPDLIQHEWAKHGTCTGRDPAPYFARSRAMYQAVHYPDMNSLSRRDDLTVDRFINAFVSENPAIPVKSVRVTTTRDGWLDELWLCLDTRFRYTACKTSQGGSAGLRQNLRIWRGR